jgi:hypothetical protein
MSEYNTPWKLQSSNRHGPFAIYDKAYNLLWPEIIDYNYAKFIVDCVNNCETLKQDNAKLSKIKEIIHHWDISGYMSGDDAIKDIKDLLE